MDFEDAMKSDPKKLLSQILRDVHLYYILPYEMMLETGDYLTGRFGVPYFSIALSEQMKVDFSEKTPQVKKFVDSFYDMASKLGFEHELHRSGSAWWKK